LSTFSYIPHTDASREKMLQTLGIDSVNELFSDIPETVRMKRPLQLMPAMSEMELDRHMRGLASQNLAADDVVSFLGAGSYHHYQPSVVEAIIGRSEFYTSYTPYQAEISQGLLQATFEYQTMISELTGMDMANASMYDGPTALAEAALVTCAQTRRNKVLVARTMHPEYRAVLATYAAGQSVEVVEIPYGEDGRVDAAHLESLLDADVAGVLVQYPNFYGGIEDLRTLADQAHAAGALLVVNTYPIALGLLETPGQLGADLVVAEGQSLGNATSFGGPYLGIMAAKKELMRRLPGRIVGQTRDHDGKRGFVLTLQAREQHIRREKATSNICSNQALNAIAATVFLSYLGPTGMRDLAQQNYHKAHYLANRLAEVNGVSLAFSQPFFNEFVVRLPQSVQQVQDRLLEQGFLFGLALAPYDEGLHDAVLLNVTELRTRAELDALVEELEGVL
jgi:glycine dehydrogenase subunit 1